MEQTRLKVENLEEANIFFRNGIWEAKWIPFVQSHMRNFFPGVPFKLWNYDDCEFNVDHSKKNILIDLVCSPESITKLQSMQNEKTIYIDMLEFLCYVGKGFCYELLKDEQRFARDHFDEYVTLADNFTDDRSKKILLARRDYFLNFDRWPVIKLSDKGKNEYFSDDPTVSIVPKPDEVYVDIGAWEGDTVKKFLRNATRGYAEIHAIEPDKRNFATLENLCSTLKNTTVYNLALGEENGTVAFSEDEENTMGSQISGRHINTLIECRRFDELNLAPTLIKIDVEGYESKVLRGARETISKYKPTLAIGCYHYSHDMFEIMETVNSIYRYKYIALRHYATSPNEYIMYFSDSRKFY